jgi:hypothetical protein
MGKYYAVRVGRENGVVVRSWDECKKLVDGYSGAQFKSFWDEDSAIDFASDTPTPKRTKKKAYRKGETLNDRFNRLNPCVERKSYFCPVKGVYFNNRCIRRKGPTITGSNYIPNNDTSIPWDT